MIIDDLWFKWYASSLFFYFSPSRQEDPPRPFLLHSCLRSSEEEVRFLQKCSQVLVYCLLPSKDVQSVSLRIVLAEILATKGRSKIRKRWLTIYTYTILAITNFSVCKSWCSAFSFWNLISVIASKTLYSQNQAYTHLTLMTWCQAAYHISG